MKNTGPLELEVSDFGPIVSAKIDLRPLTVFVGPSNTGKSYLAILIYALHQFFSGGSLGIGQRSRVGDLPSYRHAVRASRGKLSDKTTEALLDFLSSLASEDGAKDGNLIPVPEPVAASLRPVLGSVSEAGELLSGHIRRCFGIDVASQLIRSGSATSANIVLRKCASKDNDRTVALSYDYNIGKGKTSFAASFSPDFPLQMQTSRRWSSRLDFRYRSRGEPSLRESSWYPVLNDLLEAVVPYVVDPVGRPTYYLPAGRTGVMHAHRTVMGSLISQAPYGGIRAFSPGPTLPGGVADFLETLIELDTRRARLRTRDDRLAKRLETEILGGSVRSKRSATGFPSFSYRPDGWKRDLPLINVSSMVSELAPVVLYLRHVVRPGDVLIIEEPESHLHPAMQVAFTRWIAAAVHEDVRIIVTTHSEWVLEALTNLVRLSDLSEKDRKNFDGGDVALSSKHVGAWRFEPKRRPRGSVVREIRLDTDSGGFPAGYGDVAVDLYNTWAEASSRIQERNVQ